ncbi:MAG: hypothetical protein WBA31_08465 [Candidatus Dormiibacterota bacterium]
MADGSGCAEMGSLRGRGTAPTHPGEAMTRAHAIVADDGNPDHARPSITVQLLHVPACPRVDTVRDMLRKSLATTDPGITFEDLEGPHPSPTLLIDGVDVTGHEPARGPSCRLDLPTEDDIIAALCAGAVPEEAA